MITCFNEIQILINYVAALTTSIRSLEYHAKFSYSHSSAQLQVILYIFHTSAFSIFKCQYISQLI